MVSKILVWLRHSLSKSWGLIVWVFRFLIGAVTRLRIAIFVTVLLGLVAFVTAPPAGTILLLHRDGTVPEISRAELVLRRALAAANSRIALANTTRAMFDPDFADRQEITEYFGPSRLDEILDFSVEVEVSDGPIKTTLGVDAAAIFQTVVDRLLLRPSSILIVDAHTKTDDTELMILTAYRSASREISATRRGESDLLDDQMIEGASNFLTEHFFDAVSNCSRQLCGLHFPHDTSEIGAVARAFSALGSRQYIGACEGISDELTCLNAIMVEVQSVSSDFIVKDMLLLLHALRNLQLIIEERPQATDALGSALDELHERVVIINSVPQFESLLQSDDALTHFLQSAGLSDLGLTAPFLSTAQFYQDGRLKLQSGEREAAVEAFLSISSPPDWFQPYLHSVIIHQAFEPEAMSLEEALAIIDQISAAGLEVDYIRHAIIGVLYQRLIRVRFDDAPQEVQDQLMEKSLSAWTSAIETTNSEYDRIGARLELARTQYLVGQGNAARTIFEDILPSLRVVDTEDENYRLAFMSAAAVSAILEEYSETQWLLEHAFSLHPRNICAYGRLDEFDGFEDHVGKDQHSEWIALQREVNSVPCN